MIVVKKKAKIKLEKTINNKVKTYLNGVHTKTNGVSKVFPFPFPLTSTFLLEKKWIVSSD